MKRFYIPLETRPKKNSKVMNTKTHRMFCSPQYRQWHEAAFMMIKSKVQYCIEHNCYIILIFTHGDYIKRDADNGVSSIFDVLVETQQLLDDNWKVIKTHYVYNDYSKNNPSCEVRIYEQSELEDFITDSVTFARNYK